MKHLFALLLIAMAATHSAARTPDVLTATLLTPEGETQVFKGARAFIEAWDAAPWGSTITLSPGTFDNPPYVLEDMTIIGSGIEEDPDNGIIPTVLGGGHIYVGNNCLIEGIKIKDGVIVKSSSEQINNVQLVKCNIRILSIGKGNKFVTNNFTIRQCVINHFIWGGLNSSYPKEDYPIHNNLFISNSHINILETGYVNESSSILVDHCLLHNNDNKYNLTQGTYTNSITRVGSYGNSIIKNCIFLDGAKCSSNVAEFVYQESSENLFKL